MLGRERYAPFEDKLLAPSAHFRQMAAQQKEGLRGAFSHPARGESRSSRGRDTDAGRCRPYNFGSIRCLNTILEKKLKTNFRLIAFYVRFDAWLRIHRKN